MPVPQGLHPSTYENGKPDQDINSRAHTGVALELPKTYVPGLTDLDARPTEPGWKTVICGRTGIKGKSYDQAARPQRGENCSAGL